MPRGVAKNPSADARRVSRRARLDMLKRSLRRRYHSVAELASVLAASERTVHLCLRAVQAELLSEELVRKGTPPDASTYKIVPTAQPRK